MALQVGLPLIVQERFLAAYDFIPRSAVAVAGAEGDAGAMHALLAMSAAQLEDKLMNVRLSASWATRLTPRSRCPTEVAELRVQVLSRS